MTTTEPSGPSASELDDLELPDGRAAARPRWLVPALIVLAVSVVLLWFGRQDADAAHWTTGHATVTGTQATIDADGWTFGPAGAVQLWIDRDGAQHQASWPACLPDGADADVRVAWAPFELDGATDRVIVAVDCRG